MAETSSPLRPPPQGRRRDDRFLADVQQELGRLTVDLRSAEQTLDLLFLAFLLKTSRFGMFRFGPVAIDVRAIEDIVTREVRTSDGDPERARYADDCLRFFRVLTDEIAASGRRRVDELHFLLAFMRVREGLPGRVFAELGVTPEQVEAYARRGSSEPERLYSPEEAADYFGVHERTVRNWIRAGRLPASRLAGQRVLRIRASDLEALLEPVDPAEVE